ncbi:hypothetical protein X759_33270 [Mesorhizobium sp. LSHC420B00]|uniref:hypothetical protein n=1 Tax=unclassified Mesorhizobium TaxID=325217 RepID=UPI0003CE368C|nr:hypothetical protein [Mesorhizobium sp. LSHC420B00]ESX63855.1 hypothetical protein X759_33270 [Mesorhizobium sp. LSHC420B00]
MVTDGIKVAFPASIAINEAAKATGDQTLVASVLSFEALGTKLDRETQTAIKNALTNPSQAVKDAAQTQLKAANDAVDAIQASARYAEREARGYQDVLSAAERRAREGKVVDAIWHLGTDKLRVESDNAAQLMQESEVARTTAQGVASSYGPAGTAAFAAWYEYYRSKGDVQKALFTGIYTYAVATGRTSINTMPTGTIEETLKKSATAAAVRGLAVAAAGGNQEDILKAAAQEGGSVIVQSGQAYVTKEYVNPARAKADQFCVSTVGDTCGDAVQWVDDTKKQLEDYNNQLRQVGALANSFPTTLVTGDGQWAISGNKAALFDAGGKVPGAVLTYIGPGSAYRKSIQRIVTPPPPLPPHYVPPPTYDVSIPSAGLWIDDRAIPIVPRRYADTIEIFVDGNPANTVYLIRGFETLDLDLAAGVHKLRFRANIRSVNHQRITGDCDALFTVTNTAVFHPHIRFQADGPGRGHVSACSLTPG